MALKRLDFSSPRSFLLLFTIVLVFCTSVAAIRLPPLDELKHSTALDRPSVVKRQTTGHSPGDDERTEPVISAKKKKPQVIRLGIKLEEHGTGHLPIPTEEATQRKQARRNQQDEPEDNYTQSLEHTKRDDTEDGHMHGTSPPGRFSRAPYDGNTVGHNAGRDSSISYPYKSPSPTTATQRSINLARRGLELLREDCFLPDPLRNGCFIDKCHCVTYNRGLGSEFSSTGECWCPMREIGSPRNKKREISLENEEEDYQEYRAQYKHDKQELRRRALLDNTEERLFVSQQLNSIDREPGFPRIYRREPEPLPEKKNMGEGRGKKMSKCKGAKCNKRAGKGEGKRKSKSRINRRDPYMYRGRHRDFELEL